ncbi:MAG TPA: peptide ABC transporter substrate-binding protein [Polyangiaceae bacterium]|nr:peptide ABC transporter substrate-binding protein [Polyangiaceae bacterium]
MYRTLFGILTVFAAALLLVALTFSSTLEPPADLRVANGTEPKSLDPELMTGEPEHALAEALFEGLTRLDGKTLKPVPGASIGWDISPDGTVYTFKLRPGARWSDGVPVTSADFVYSWKRLLDPKVGAEYAYMLFPIELAEAYNTFAGHAASIGDKILPALAALAKNAPIDAKSWQAFVRDQHVNDPLRPVDDDSLVALLSRRSGSVSAAELAAFGQGLERARAWLLAQNAEARAHFGVDRGVSAPDPATLVVKLRAPTPYFLQVLSHNSAMPVPRQAIAAHGDAWFLPGNIVTNGPFRLASWVVNDHIRLEKSPSYWGKNAVRLDRVDMLSNDNTMTNVNLYLTGAVDVVPHSYYPQELAPELRTRPDFEQAAALIVYFYRLNVTKKPLDDKRVRKALNLAIDRDVITKNVLGLGQQPATTFVPPGIPGYTPPVSGIRHDVEEARRLLADAGFPGGKGFPRLGILYNTNEDHKRIAEVVSDQLRRALGIEVTAYNQEWQSFLDTVRGLDYDIGRAGWIADYVDPNSFLDMFVTNGANNETGWSSELYDRLIRAAGDVSLLVRDPEPILTKLRDPEPARRLLEATRAGTPAERQTAREKLRLLLLREAESILVDDEYPIIPVYFYVIGTLARERVHGFSMQLTLDDGTTVPNLQDRHPLRDVWVEGPRTGRP